MYFVEDNAAITDERFGGSSNKSHEVFFRIVA